MKFSFSSYAESDNQAAFAALTMTDVSWKPTGAYELQRFLQLSLEYPLVEYITCLTTLSAQCQVDGIVTPSFQDRNDVGVRLLRKVQSKLNGEHTNLSISEHAHELVQRATKDDHLCLMYEGWTPWV